ncbi:MAG: hypothetical protein NTX97_09000 [Bacteroidetes bacterium]|nr:hypothetical protein [Bacteroidota bacterium]
MNRRLLLSFVGIFLILIVGSCSHDNGKAVDEGSIEFTATVVDQNNPMATLAPSKMVIKFKHNKSCAEMSAGMGLFVTSFISNPEKKTLTQLVKLLTKKFSLVQNAAEIAKENEAFKLELTPLKETKIIAGYKCQKAHVKMADELQTEFDIFYTNELSIENPNFANPFYMIDGVLMEYQMKKFGLEMKFTAKTVKKEDIDDATFELPADYKAISAKEMADFIASLQ